MSDVLEVTERAKGRAAQLAKREAILRDWAACEPASLIAQRHATSDSNVYRIAREYGGHITTRTERGCEMKRAEQFADAIVKNYNEGGSIEQIASQLGIQPREVRAAVYLAIQRGEIRAYKQATATP